MKKAERKVADKFKEIVATLGINCEKIILFGSRATENYTEDSDWDFLLIVKEPISDKDKRTLKARIRIEMHNSFPTAFIDIMIVEKSRFNEEKDIVNTISNEAFSFGVAV
jgi:predicted nucleotidyltransferase